MKGQGKFYRKKYFHLGGGTPIERIFLQKGVPQKKREGLLRAAHTAPTGSNSEFASFGRKT